MPHARSSRSARSSGPNRTDLMRPGPEPITTAPGQTYGEGAQQQLAEKAAPIGAPPGSQPTSQNPQQPLAIPGANGPLSRPSERPNEPVTHGLPMGPGPGPETLTGIGAAARQGAVQQGTLTNLLTNLAAQPNATSAIQDLAARATSGVQ